MASEHSNIVVIVWHDLGDYLSCYRPDVQTPHLARLAREGATFQNAFATAPVCSPARGSLMTGLYPHSHGLLGLAHYGWAYRTGVRDLPAILETAGYSTHLIGIEHERYDHGTRTYQHATDLKETTDIADRSCRFFREQAQSQEPFCLSIGFRAVHRDFECDSGPAAVGELPRFLPDEPVVRNDLACFYSYIADTDRAVGKILQALEEAGQAQDTIVVFVSDHGPDYPRAKLTLYDPGIKVALLLRYPRRISPGTRIDSLASGVDVTPTLLDLAGLGQPTRTQGLSFAPLLEDGSKPSPRTKIFAESNFAALCDPVRCVRTSRYKYVQNFSPGLPIRVTRQASDRLGLDLLNRHFSRPRPEEELYDLAADPGERENLCDRPAMAGPKEELAKALAAWMEETGDPLLSGTMPDHPPVAPGAQCIQWEPGPEGFTAALKPVSCG
jgi:arylsulfatase A-like enzyme